MNIGLIEELVLSIKEEDAYQRLRQSEKALEQENIQNLMKNYSRKQEERQELKAYENYIDTKELDQEIVSLREELYQYPEVIHYLEAMASMNALLDDVTALVFGHISDELAIGRMEKTYARYRR